MEREFLDYYDWLNAGGLEGTGQKVEAPTGQPSTAPGTDDWLAPWLVLNPPYDAPAGQTWVRNPQTGVWELQASVPGTNNVPATNTGAGGTTSGDVGSGNGGWGWLTEPFTRQPPSYRPGATFQPPTFTTPPPFSYKSFEAPTKESIYADPSYQFRLGQGQQALEQSAAGRGILRTGGTLKDLVNYGQNAASQEYSNIFDRAVQAHNLGLQQELGTYGVNYGVTRDAYDRLFDANKAVFEAQERENVRSNQREVDNFLSDFDIFEKNRRRAGDYLFRAAELGG